MILARILVAITIGGLALIGYQRFTARLQRNHRLSTGGACSDSSVIQGNQFVIAMLSNPFRTPHFLEFYDLV